jgi:tetratricopeptide (TPR) repeat protein
VATREIKDRIGSSIYKQGEQARDAGDLEAAVGHFRRLGQAVPDSTFRETAEYDAAAALIAMGAWDRASTVLEEFRRDYPDSEFADDVTQKLAVTYLEAGQGAQAAGEFERIASAPGATDDVRREALWRASDLYKESGSVASEQRVLESIVARYPDPVAESIEARARLLEIAGEQGQTARRAQILADIVYADATAGAQRSDRTRFLAAKASLELAEPVRRSFSVMKITQPLAESMELKKSLMEDVLKVYGDAAAYGIAEVTTAATFRLGEAYQQFSRDLMDSERPRGLDELALEQYELLLEEQTFPFEEKSIELYETNVARAADGVWDEWVQRSFSQLATLMPARYAKAERSENVVTSLY